MERPLGERSVCANRLPAFWRHASLRYVLSPTRSPETNANQQNCNVRFHKGLDTAAQGKVATPRAAYCAPDCIDSGIVLTPLNTIGGKN
jgi:hypothetical protein